MLGEGLSKVDILARSCSPTMGELLCNSQGSSSASDKYETCAITGDKPMDRVKLVGPQRDNPVTGFVSIRDGSRLVGAKSKYCVGFGFSHALKGCCNTCSCFPPDSDLYLVRLPPLPILDLDEPTIEPDTKVATARRPLAARVGPAEAVGNLPARVDYTALDAVRIVRASPGSRPPLVLLAGARRYANSSILPLAYRFASGASSVEGAESTQREKRSDEK